MSAGIIAASLSSPNAFISVARVNGTDYTYTMNATPVNPILFDGIQNSTSAISYSTSTGLFTVNLPGVYLITAQVQIEATSFFTPCNTVMTKNSATILTGLGANFNVLFPGSPGFYSALVTGIMPFIAGDVLAFYLVGNYTGSSGPPSTLTVRGFTQATFAQISFLRSQ